MKGLSILTILLFLTGSPILASCEKSIVQSGEMEEVDMDVEGNGEVSLLYMGQASIRIVTETGHVIYIDPYAGNQYDLAADQLQGRFGTRNSIFWHTCAKSCAKEEVLVFPNGVKKVLKAVFNS